MNTTTFALGSADHHCVCALTRLIVTFDGTLLRAVDERGESVTVSRQSSEDRQSDASPHGHADMASRIGDAGAVPEAERARARPYTADRRAAGRSGKPKNRTGDTLLTSHDTLADTRDSRWDADGTTDHADGYDTYTLVHHTAVQQTAHTRGTINDQASFIWTLER